MSAIGIAAEDDVSTLDATVVEAREALRAQSGLEMPSARP